MPEFTRKQLIKAAKEMNEVMGLEDPALDVTLPEPQLKAQITKAIKLINQDEDEFSDATTAVIDALRPAPPEDVDDEDEDNGDDDTDDDEDEEDEPDADAEEPDADAADDTDTEEDVAEEATAQQPLPQQVANTAKLADLKALVAANVEFKKLRKSLDNYAGLTGPKELKAAMFRLLNVTPPAPAVKKRKPREHKEMYGRFQAAADAILAGITDKAAIYTRANELYVQHGGKAEPKRAKVDCDRVFRVLKAMGLGTSKGKTFTYKQA
jgi:hypothetical protein